MNKSIYIFLCVFALLAACKKQDIYSTQKGCKIEEVKGFGAYTVRSRINYEEGENKFSFVANIRVKEDSVIWISAGTGSGIEAMRCVIRQDSMFVVDKMGKRYAKRSMQELKDRYGYDIDYFTLQNAILGNVTFPSHKKPKLKNDEGYCIAQQLMRPFNVVYYVGKRTKKIEKVEVADLETENTLEITYSDFENVDDKVLADDIHISLNYKNNAEMDSLKIEIKQRSPGFTDKVLKFPFHIPSKYEAQ